MHFRGSRLLIKRHHHRVCEEIVYPNVSEFFQNLESVIEVNLGDPAGKPRPMICNYAQFLKRLDNWEVDCLFSILREELNDNELFVYNMSPAFLSDVLWLFNDHETLSIISVIIISEHLGWEYRQCILFHLNRTIEGLTELAVAYHQAEDNREALQDLYEHLINTLIVVTNLSYHHDGLAGIEEVYTKVAELTLQILTYRMKTAETELIVIKYLECELRGSAGTHIFQDTVRIYKYFLSQQKNYTTSEKVTHCFLTLCDVIVRGNELDLIQPASFVAMRQFGHSSIFSQLMKEDTRRLIYEQLDLSVVCRYDLRCFDTLFRFLDSNTDYLQVDFYKIALRVGGSSSILHNIMFLIERYWYNFDKQFFLKLAENQQNWGLIGTLIKRLSGSDDSYDEGQFEATFDDDLFRALLNI